MVTVIVKRNTGLDIVRRININDTIKYMRRWIGGINMLDQRLRNRFAFQCQKVWYCFIAGSLYSFSCLFFYCFLAFL